MVNHGSFFYTDLFPSFSSLLFLQFGLRRYLPAKSPVIKPLLGSVQGTGDLSEERLDTYNWTAY